MAGTSFDDLESSGEMAPNDKPIWTIDEGDDKKLHHWLKSEISYLKDQNKQRLQEIWYHLNIYKGRGPSAYYDTRRPIEDIRYTQSISQDVVSRENINHIYDLTEQKISGLVKYKPAVSIIPTNDEFSDKVSSDVAKSLWMHIQNVQHFDRKAQDFLRWVFPAGEGYLWIEWDGELGKTHPEVEMAQRQEKVIQVEGADGEKKELKKEVKVGDVKLSIRPPDKIFLQDKDCFDEVEYFFSCEKMHIEEVKKKWPKVASSITQDPNENLDIRDQANNDRMYRKNQTVVWEFYHKKTEYMPDGLFVKFTKDAILEQGPNPYEHGEFPFERLCDIEVPGEPYGKSGYVNIRKMNNNLDQLSTMIMRNLKLASHPKWFVPRGSVKIDSLGNSTTIVQYSGAQPPVLSSTSPTPREVFDYRTQLKQDMEQVYGVYGTSRGEPPAGVTAAVALQFLDEQENNRQNGMISRWNDWIRRVCKKTLSVAGQFYDQSDDRMIMVLGKDGAWQTQAIDPEALSSEFTITIQNSSALPESKAARMSSILELGKTFPGIMSPERILDLLDFSQSDKFTDVVTAATKCAEVENEKILQGQSSELLAPQEWEFHVCHWEVHASKLQEYQIKAFAPPEILQSLKDHIMTHEMWMYNQAEKNPAYQQTLMGLKQFPLVFAPPPPPPPPPMPEAPPMAEMPPPAPESGAEGALTPDQLTQGETPAGLPPLPEDQMAIQPSSSI